MAPVFDPVLVVPAAILALAVGTAWLVFRLAARADDRELDRAGVTVRGKVTQVDPMERGLNRAAGQPVRLTYRDARGSQHHVTDESGLGGYLVRAGTPVVLRYCPSRPQLVRVVKLVGRSGRPYPVWPDGLPKRSLLLPLSLVAAGGLGAVYVGRVRLWDSGQPPAAIDLALLLLTWGLGLAATGLLIAAIVSGIDPHARSAASEHWAETVGEVTDVWSRTGPDSPPHCLFTVRFAARDGREVHTRHRSPSRVWLHPGQPVRVRYDPAHPVRFVARPIGERSDGGDRTDGAVV